MIIKLFYEHGYTLVEIGELVGLSGSRFSQKLTEIKRFMKSPSTYSIKAPPPQVEFIHVRSKEPIPPVPEPVIPDPPPAPPPPPVEPPTAPAVPHVSPSRRRKTDTKEQIYARIMALRNARVTVQPPEPHFKFVKKERVKRPRDQPPGDNDGRNFKPVKKG